MKTRFQSFLLCGLVVSAAVFFSRCDDDDDGPQLTGDTKQYVLSSVSNPAISGTVTFSEQDDDRTVVVIQLTGTAPGAMHPAHIHANSAAAGGAIVIDLESVDGADGRSETTVAALNDGTPITYDALLDFNGYVNVHMSATDLGTLVAQGDIGGNELTGDATVYTFQPVVDPNVSGTATFAKRKNGSTLVTVDLENKQVTADHASHIHANTIAEGGPITINLKNVNGVTGFAASQVDSLNNGTPITYEELLNFNGYLNVHQGASFVVQADIGQNELTDVHEHYVLDEVEGSGVAGTATFEKRKNGKTLVTIQLEGTTAGGDHPAHIHVGSVETGGGIFADLKNISGASGISLTNVVKNRDDGEVTYDELVSFDGHINVHLSTTELGTVIATGNIGANVQ